MPEFLNHALANFAPGVVRSSFRIAGMLVFALLVLRLIDSALKRLRLLIPAAGDAFGLTRAEQGAETLVWLASSPDLADVTGQYFYQCRPGTLTADARDDALAQRLWAESEAISTFISLTLNGILPAA